MKKLLTVLLALLMVLALAGCGEKKEETAAPETETSGSGKIKVNIMSFTDEVPGMFDKFLAANPQYAAKYEPNVTIIATTDGLYQPALDEALAAQDGNTPDIYAAEAAFVLKYAQGDASQYAASYEDLGINVAKKVADAEIAGYTVDIGTRPADGKVVGLGYQCNGGVFIYRRSIAKAVLGSDDPEVVAEALGAGSGSWDKFWDLAEKCKAAGYKIISGDGDMWHAVENSSSTGWLVDGNKLNLPAEREAFLDQSKKLYENEYTNNSTDWQDSWFADMKEDGTALGFYGPCWLINYTLAPNSNTNGENSSYGDWAVCAPNIGFFWGGTWLFAGKTAVGSPKQTIVKDFIEWVTLQTGADSLQDMWANGTYSEGGTPDSVASAVVMATADGTTEFCGNQNVFDAFIPANKLANGQNLTQYDEKINSLWRDQVKMYATGQIDRDTAIKQWKENVAAEFDVVVE